MSPIKENVKEILINYRKDNPYYWCTCLPNELKKGDYYYRKSFRLDYIILMPISPKHFLSDGIDLSQEAELLLTKTWYDDIVLTLDN